jgi:excisionase family DNA binding protein
MNRNNKDKILLDVRELSELTGLSPYTLYSWINQRKIPYVKVGRLVRFEPKKIEKWIEENSVKQTD